MRALAVLLSLLLSPGTAWPASVQCLGVDDTVAIQAAVDSSPYVSLADQTCVVDARVGIRVPSDRTIDATGATISILPGCQPRCYAFGAIGSKNVTFINGTVIGDLSNISGVEWRMGWFIDGEADNIAITGTTLQDWRTDGIRIGGNAPGPKNIRVSRVLIERSGRNHITVSCGSKITIERSVLRNIVTAPGKPFPDPGAGIDVEPNVGERVTDLVISEVESYNNQKGFFVQWGHGTGACTNCSLSDNTATGNVEWNFAVNSVDGGRIVGNKSSGSPICYTIGAHSEAARARRLIIADNVASQCTIGMRIAGVRDSEVVRNTLPGPILRAALGDSGDMLYRGNIQR